jgi:Ax21 family sulfation-dependent quorum factor
MARSPQRYRQHPSDENQTRPEPFPMSQRIVALLLLAALPLSARAGELTYSYVEAGYSRIPDILGVAVFPSGESGTDDGTGMEINGSWDFGVGLFGFGGYRSVDASVSLPSSVFSTDLSVDEWTLGLGYHYGLSDSMDLVARLGARRAEVESGLVKSTDLDGYFSEVGVRSQLASRFEGYLYAGYERPEGGEGDTYGRVGAQFKFNPSWGLVADAKFGSGDKQYFLGPRLSF